jgi:hypothetical protein
MPDLSPAAQAVLDAFDKQPFKKADGDLNVEGALAAALRAAAVYCTRERRILMTIADELDNTAQQS